MYGNIVSVDDDAVRERYIKQLDGVMIESFATDWSNAISMGKAGNVVYNR